MHCASNKKLNRGHRQGGRFRVIASGSRRAVANFALSLLALGSVAVSALEVRQVDHDGERYQLVELDLRHDRLDLRWKDDDGRALASIEGLRAWADSRRRTLLFAANAGIYDQAFRPLGLHIEDGTTWRRLNTVRLPGTVGNFSMQPNGVFYVDQDGKAGVMTTAQWQSKPPAARIASQSGPMLVVDGEVNASFDAKSNSRKIRSGVCAPNPDSVAFAISTSPVSFHRFGSFMRDALGCHEALFLDGSLSQFWTPQTGYVGAPAPMLKPYVGMFVVFADPAQ